MTTELDAKTFDEALKKNQVTLVDFWASWCMPCKMLAPTIEQLAEEYKGKALVAKVDIDANEDLATRFSIMSIPSLVIFKNGKIADMLVGALPKSTIKAALDKHLEKK